MVKCVYSHESNVVHVSIMQFCMTGGLCCRMQDGGALSVRGWVRLYYYCRGSQTVLTDEAILSPHIMAWGLKLRTWSGDTLMTRTLLLVATSIITICSPLHGLQRQRRERDGGKKVTRTNTPTQAWTDSKSPPCTLTACMTQIKV